MEQSTETPRHARAISIFILVLLTIQILAPLRYYLGNSAPDERFCWRMFSTRQHELESDDYRLTVTEYRGEDSQTLDLQSTISQPWIRFMQFGFKRVINEFLAWRAHGEGVTRIVLRLEAGRRSQALEIEHPQNSP